MIGYFLKRNNFSNASVAELLKELQHNLFEADIMQNAIQNLQKQHLTAFDCAVGDWKCQTRTSMVIDFLQDEITLKKELSQELNKIKNIIIKNQELLEKIQHYGPAECQKLRHQLISTSLKTYFQNHDLDYTPSTKLTLLSLSFLTTTQNNNSSLFIKHQISGNKIKAFINLAKKLLCDFSVNYELKLAKLYNSHDEQKSLQQIEFNRMQHMTSLFSSFKSIFQKMKIKQQPFITETIHFCACGGVQSIQIKFFKPHNNSFVETTLPHDLTQSITVIHAYQFPGSLDELQNVLKIKHNTPKLPQSTYTPCKCSNPTKPQIVNSIDEAIMAFFAQHPQFTNGAEIDFKKFDLENSELKKEYEYLKTLKGFSRNDMSKFQIIHIYPSTIADVLKETEEIEAKLKAETNKKDIR